MIKRVMAAFLVFGSLTLGTAFAADVPDPPPAAPAADTQPTTSTAILGALDKITAKVTRIEIEQDKPVKFGTLEIVMRTCHGNPPEEAPEAAAFLEISESRNGQAPARLFTGWMFASSPSLSALDHPVYDVWVVSCKTTSGAGLAPSK